MDRITDSEALVQGLLLGQYKGKPRLAALLRAFANEGNSLEEMLWDIRDGFWLRNAVGVQLEILGQLYGIERQGMALEVYRVKLIAQAASMVNGSPEEIMAMLRWFLGATSVLYVPEYPAGFWVIPDVGADTITAEFLRQLAPAGVEVLPPCFLADARGAAIITADLAYILVVGPCAPFGPDPDYLVLDGLVGTLGDLSGFTIMDGLTGGSVPETSYDFGGGPA